MELECICSFDDVQPCDERHAQLRVLVESKQEFGQAFQRLEEKDDEKVLCAMWRDFRHGLH
jgi:hypothetical protein